jgi:hypothetical protein
MLNSDVVPSSPILVTLMIEAIRSSEVSVLTRATRSNIQADGILRNLMEFFPSSEAASFPSSHELTNSFWNPKVHCSIHRSSPLIHILF